MKGFLIEKGKFLFHIEKEQDLTRIQMEQESDYMEYQLIYHSFNKDEIRSIIDYLTRMIK